MKLITLNTRAIDVQCKLNKECTLRLCAIKSFTWSTPFDTDTATDRKMYGNVDIALRPLDDDKS